MVRGRLVSFPIEGAYRVHRAPTKLTLRDHPRHRYDDPEGAYAVWYFASNLSGSMIEAFDQFRESGPTERALAAVGGVSGLDIIAVSGVNNPYAEEFPASVPSRYLSELRFAKAVLEPNPGEAFANVEDSEFLSGMTLRPRVHAVLGKGTPDPFGTPPKLNLESVRSPHPAARELTQVLSRETYVEPSSLSGVRYTSRHTDNEDCWAVFDDQDASRSRVVFVDDEPLDSLEPFHCAAVQQAAKLLGLALPALWTE